MDLRPGLHGQTSSAFYINIFNGPSWSTVQTSADSTVHVLSLSRFCPDLPENRVRCLSAVRFQSGFSVRCLSIRILSVLSRSCPPSGFRQDFLEKRLSSVCLSGFCSKIVCPVSVWILSGYCLYGLR